MSTFWEKNIQPGYYDRILEEGSKNKFGLQINWHEIQFEFVSKKIDKNSQHLDFACGPGTFIGNYLNTNSLGVDLSKNQIKYAVEKYGQKSKFLDLSSFDFNLYPNYFDCITVLGLVEFLNNEEIKELINNFYLITKPAGKVIFTTPNYGIIMTLLEKIIGIFGKVSYKNQTINRFKYRKLQKTFDNSEFEIIKIQKILNYGIFCSIFNKKIGKKFENYLGKIFNYRFGFILVLELSKSSNKN